MKAEGVYTNVTYWQEVTVMNYCSHCGTKVILRVPTGDNRERYTCDQCDTIHYQNPCIITGTLPIYKDQVLLCKRAIAPRYGLWTLPAGFMENGESTEDGAIRETQEEAQARVRVDDLYTLFDLPHINQVYFFYRAQLIDLSFCAGEESLEVALFDEADIPWSELAFPVVTRTLEHFFNDRKNQSYPLRREVMKKMI